MVERTFVLVKPDAVARDLTQKILQRFRKEGLIVQEVHRSVPTPPLIERHYRQKFQEKPDIRDFVITYLTSGEAVAVVLAGEDAVSRVRKVVGPLENPPRGTIRGDYGGTLNNSLVHASDSVQAAQYEMALWFPTIADQARHKREHLFATAIACQNKGLSAVACQKARECLEMLRSTAGTADDEAATAVQLSVMECVVLLPEYLHTETATRAFRAAGIDV